MHRIKDPRSAQRPCASQLNALPLLLSTAASVHASLEREGCAGDRRVARACRRAHRRQHPARRGAHLRTAAGDVRLWHVYGLTPARWQWSSRAVLGCRPFRRGARQQTPHSSCTQPAEPAGSTGPESEHQVAGHRLRDASSPLNTRAHKQTHVHNHQERFSIAHQQARRARPGGAHAAEPRHGGRGGGRRLGAVPCLARVLEGLVLGEVLVDAVVQLHANHS